MNNIDYEKFNEQIGHVVKAIQQAYVDMGDSLTDSEFEYAKRHYLDYSYKMFYLIKKRNFSKNKARQVTFFNLIDD